MERVGLLR